MNVDEMLVFTAFLFISTTSLLPWNLFMNAHEYYHYKLRNISDHRNESLIREDNVTDLQRSYEGWITLISGFSCTLGSAVNFLTTGRVKNSFRIRAGHATVLLALIPTVLLTYINTDKSQLTFFWCSMVLSGFASFGSIGLIGCGLLGFSAKYPQKCVQAVMIGQSVAGILSSLLSIVCQFLTTSDILNGRFFFFIACVWTVVSVLIYESLIRSKKMEAQLAWEVDNIDGLSGQRLLDPLGNDFEDEPPLQLRSVQTNSFSDDVKLVWSKTNVEWWAGFVVIAGTLSAFPALSSLVQTTAKNLIWKSRADICDKHCLLISGIQIISGFLLDLSQDYVKMGILRVNQKVLVIFSLLRLLTIPLFFFCNINPRRHSTTFFTSDIAFITIMTVFSFSNGFLYTTATVNATNKVRQESRELTGSIFGFMGVISTLCGSLIGLLLVNII
ncbi:unnamed protein product [Thelazia callipaeda]|uniref:Equilibrative nucleoside transporter 1 n=1 Tax=Thelazia callipaeda TaxID=103827 RepID=A0A0N5DA94_THECL|nr:unnamed protein product [Thelazia callipaeda]